MSETKRSGWVADTDGKGNWFVLTTNPVGLEDVAAICATNGYGENEARLIAAAPDLLVALQGVVRVADRKTDEFDAAHAAVAKALGSAK
jgi:hypothetical protein